MRIRASFQNEEFEFSRSFLEKLLQAVEPCVKKKADADGIVLGRPVRADITFSKPTRKV
jgi:hypothetical protein